MTKPMTYSFPRYLAAKKSVDDRALNRSVWQALAQELPTKTPLRVLEIGAGVGTMLERMLDRRLLNQAMYTGIDALAENVAAAYEILPGRAAGHGFTVETSPTGELQFDRPGQRVTARFEAVDLFDFAARNHQPQYDFLLAHAFLDLMDVPATLPLLFNLLCSGGLFYFSLNFDGLTLLEPVIDPELDTLIQELYHQSMDERQTAGKPSGDSRSGRHLFAHLEQAGGRILEAGASDWVVFPRGSAYPADEAYFLHFIVHTIHQALTGHPALDPARFAAWVSARHAQVERGELVYIAHQLDFAGSTP